MRGFADFVSVVLMTFCIPVLAGCQNAPSRSPVPATPYQGVAADRMTGNSDGATVRILPENPTPQTDLVAVLSGAASNGTYRWEKNGVVLPGRETDKLPHDQFEKGDTITVTAGFAGGDVSGSVNIGNTPPMIKGVSLSPQYIFRGTDITAVPDGFDADGDTVTYFYKWTVNGEDAGDHGEILRGDQFKKGDSIGLTVVPYDREGEGQPFTSLPVVIPNGPPKITSLPVTFPGGDTYEYMVHAEDPDGDRITYSLAAAPPGMTVDSRTGRIFWQITKDSAGTNIVEVQARDEEGLNVTQKFSIAITISEGR